MVDLLLVSLVLSVAVLFLALGVLVGRALAARSLELAYREREQEARRDSVERSRSTLSGKFLEQLSPHFPDFPYDPTDLRFLGTPVDYVVFDRLCEGEIDEVVFLEIKSGRSGLSTIQRRLREAVEAGRVRWDVYRIPEDASLTETP